MTSLAMRHLMDRVAAPADLISAVRISVIFLVTYLEISLAEDVAVPEIQVRQKVPICVPVCVLLLKRRYSVVKKKLN